MGQERGRQSGGGWRVVFFVAILGLLLTSIAAVVYWRAADRFEERASTTSGGAELPGDPSTQSLPAYFALENRRDAYYSMVAAGVFLGFAVIAGLRGRRSQRPPK